jgi:hypothetical protein
VGQQISAQYAVNAVNIHDHVIAHDVLDMPRGPLTLLNGHVDPTAQLKRPDRTFRLQAISRVSHFPPPKATSRAYIHNSDVSRVFWDCGSGSGGGTRGVTGFRTLFRKRIVNTVAKRLETPENRRYAVLRRSTQYAYSTPKRSRTSLRKGLDQGPTNPRGFRGVGPTPLGVANGRRGKPELFGEKPTQARGPYLPSPRTSIGSIGGIPEELVNSVACRSSPRSLGGSHDRSGDESKGLNQA